LADHPVPYLSQSKPVKQKYSNKNHQKIGTNHKPKQHKISLAHFVLDRVRIREIGLEIGLELVLEIGLEPYPTTHSHTLPCFTPTLNPTPTLNSPLSPTLNQTINPTLNPTLNSSISNCARKVGIGDNLIGLFLPLT
jgi:hypothetical protein